MFLTFAKIGSFTIGGGYAMIQMMEKEVVDKKQWLTREEFMDTLVVAQSTPGLFAIDMASHIGWKLKGVKGGIVGALTNDALPGLVLLTEEFDITSTVGIDVLTIDPQTTVSGIYTTDGRRSGSEGRGIRIYRMTDGTSLKVLR